MVNFLRTIFVVCINVGTVKADVEFDGETGWRTVVVFVNFGMVAEAAKGDTDVDKKTVVVFANVGMDGMDVVVVKYDCGVGNVKLVVFAYFAIAVEVVEGDGDAGKETVVVFVNFGMVS